MGDQDLTQGLKMAATAVASAVFVAALVITVGGPMIERQAHASADDAPAETLLVRTGG